MSRLTPQTAYSRLNKLLWLGRLPDARVILVADEFVPNVHGVTLHDGQRLFMKPLIVLNGSAPWGKTLIHECLHVAEPRLAHGTVFDKIVRRYWRIARRQIKGL